jgi:hypothetical protein
MKAATIALAKPSERQRTFPITAIARLQSRNRLGLDNSDFQLAVVHGIGRGVQTLA